MPIKETILIIIFNLIVLNFLIFITIKLANYYKINDVPNARSLHNKSTPNIGGLPILILFFFNTIYLYFSTFSINEIYFIICLFIISFIGLMDDFFKLSSLTRFIFQFFVSLMSSFISLFFANLEINQNINISFFIIFFCSLFLIILFINIFNFMDGINGLVSIKSILFLITIFFFLIISNYNIPLEFKNIEKFILIISILLLFFLPWNFPIAKIFMGDSLSYFLGYFISFLIILLSLIDLKFIWISLILLSLFLVDTCLTILFRLVKKINIFKPHKTHAYQILTQYFQSHVYVTIFEVLVYLIILLPISFLILIDFFNGFFITIVIYLIISFLYLIIKKIKID